MNAGRSKGNAVKFLCELLNIDKEEIIAFGDNYNDAEMLSMSGESYAMSTAVPGLFKIAKHTCENVADVLENIAFS